MKGVCVLHYYYKMWKILSWNWRERSFCCCCSRFQDTWKWGKNLYPNCFLYVPTTKHREKKTCLVLGCNHILMPPSPIDVALRYTKVQAHSLNIQPKACFPSWVHGRNHKPQEERIWERERERHTHTHTHFDNIWQHNAMTFTIHSLESWKSFNYNCWLAARGRRMTFFFVILLVVVCCQLDPLEDGNEISPRRSALCFNLAANLSFHILASCTYQTPNFDWENLFPPSWLLKKKLVDLRALDLI